MQPFKKNTEQISRWPKDGAWDRIRSWPGVRGEDKLAWLYLWQTTREGRERINVNASMIAYDQGTTADAGRQRIKNLVLMGLVTVITHDRANGMYLIELPNPRDVALARKVVWDGQRTFWDEIDQQEDARDTSEPDSALSDGDILRVTRMASAEGPKDDPAEEPRSSTEDPPEVPRQRTSNLNLESDVNKTSTLTSLTSQNKVYPLYNTPTRGTSGGSSVTSGGSSAGDEPKRIDLLSRLSNLPDAGNFQERVEQLAHQYLSRVNCREMRLRPLLRLAQYVLEGRVSASEVSSLFASLESAARRGLRNNRSSYFNGALKILLCKLGLS